MRKLTKAESTVSQSRATSENPDEMLPADRKLYYQAEDLRQSVLLKMRKNALEARDVIPAAEVEQALALAFKSIALFLDSLPDKMERDDIIHADDVDKLIKMVDGERAQLRNSLEALSPIVRIL